MKKSMPPRKSHTSYINIMYHIIIRLPEMLPNMPSCRRCLWWRGRYSISLLSCGTDRHASRRSSRTRRTSRHCRYCCCADLEVARCRSEGIFELLHEVADLIAPSPTTRTHRLRLHRRAGRPRLHASSAGWGGCSAVRCRPDTQTRSRIGTER